MFNLGLLYDGDDSGVYGGGGEGVVRALSVARSPFCSWYSLRNSNTQGPNQILLFEIH